ncbi:phytanoyl-CoA dioxygenase family protein [Photorhabdus luminescens]|uniref:phytanoyl-CoA dioxygenase family protein n=1 Tax=Photorhabdus luminescens TaxID=29488 RepID=UPI00223EE272|nr:phytanoyl-CoA dioxygenase family protein [Photorhabdus luminescens]MCW7763111.1 phytanoyl-CoA dioxygenase family protein [Photorhabdus luminescens subsp. venezuelensis]
MTINLYGEYDKNGYVIVKNAISDDLLRKLRNHFENTLIRHKNIPPEKWNFWLFDNDDEWLSLISHPEIISPVEKIIGPDIIHLGSHYWAKPPKVGNKVSWHQDGAYYSLSHMNLVTIWIALDPSTKENGCLKVIPGTHKDELRVLKNVEGDPYLKRVMDSNNINYNLCHYIELKPGDVSLHNPNIIHGSEKNESTMWRRGFVIKYIAGDVDIAPEMEWPWAYLVQGECRSSVTQKILKDARPRK